MSETRVVADGLGFPESTRRLTMGPGLLLGLGHP